MDLVSGCPFWPLKNGLLATYPPLEENAVCDVAIVGGGITGALLAHFLTAEGVKVVLLDRREIGFGSTCASTSLLQYETDVPLHRLIDLVGEKSAVRTYQVGLDAVREVGRLVAKLDNPCGFSPQESLYLASTRRDLPELRLEYETRRRCGFDVAFWDRDRLARCATLPHHAAILSRDSAQVDAYRLTHALLARAQKKGAQIFDRTTVKNYRFHARGVELSTLRGPKIRAGRIVFATGYEAAVSLRSAPAALHSTYALVSEPIKNFAGWPGRRLLWETARPYLYFRTTDDGRAIVGGGDERFRDQRARDKLLPEKTRMLARRFREFFPAIDFEVAYAWTGTFAETQDSLPFIGKHSAYPRAYFALGYGGNGITFSVIAAKIIRDLCLGRKNSDAEIFRFHRRVPRRG